MILGFKMINLYQILIIFDDLIHYPKNNFQICSFLNIYLEVKIIIIILLIFEISRKIYFSFSDSMVVIKYFFINNIKIIIKFKKIFKFYFYQVNLKLYYLTDYRGF